MKKFIYFLFLFFVFPVFSIADDSVVVSKIYRGNAPYVWFYVVLTADASGNIADDAAMSQGAVVGSNGVITKAGTTVTGGLDLPAGFLYFYKVEPTTGDTQPTDNYDVYLRDDVDFDYMFGKGVDLDQLATDSGNAFGPMTSTGTFPLIMGRKFFFNASGMGADNVTVIRIYSVETKTP